MIEDYILDMIKSLGDDFNILQYVYNNDTKFIAGTTPVYYSGPFWDEKEIVSAIKTLLTGKWISAGENVKKFEGKFAGKINHKYGTMLNSGSSANLVMLASLKKFFKWQDGAEIIVSVVGFPTTTSVIVQNNLKPVFVDIEMDTLNFDLDLISEKITDKTVAIVVSPVLGNPPDFDKIIEICNRNAILLILDDCDSLGSKWNNKFLNEYAEISSHSFYPAHILSTGEGGMVTSNNKELVALAKSFATWGRACYCAGSENLLPDGMCKKRFSNWLDGYDGIVDHKYVFENMGYNLKPLDLQGSIGLIQLEKLDDIYVRRVNSKETISSIFQNYVPDVHIPDSLPKAKVIWFGTPIVVPDKRTKNKLVSFLERNKIQTRNYFAGNLLLHEGYRYLDDFRKYPNANKVLDQVLFVGAAPHYDLNIFNYFEEILGKFKYE